MASAVYILDMKGKCLIFRNYRGDVQHNIIDKFVTHVIEEEEVNIKPIFQHEDTSFIYIKFSNLYMVAVTRSNSNAAMVLEYLYRMAKVFKDYFKDVEEESIRDNFVLVYELLDEMMDFGFPQATEPKILQEYITQEGHKLEIDASPKIPNALTNAVSWRKEGIKYRKNEVFLDVVESLNVLVAANGTPIRSEIIGTLKMRSLLSGMPDLKLGLNDKVLFENMGRNVSKRRAVEMEDIKFHQCVRLNKFETNRTISFVPPDGDFDLMTYRLNTRVKPLIWVEATVEPHSHSRIEYLIKAKSQFKRRSIANNVAIRIPVPSDIDTPLFKCSAGSAEYVPEEDCILWTIKQCPGGKEYVMRAHVGLPSISSGERTDTKKPITIKFEIPYFTVSGLQVRYLKIVEKSGYQALPWVRYITQSGDYQIRMN